jgi:CheY-like chemotaxis protein
MSLRALLFSRDEQIIQVVNQVLNNLNIEVTHSHNAQDAVQRLADERFDAILVDDADASKAIRVLAAAKVLPSCQESVGIVLAASSTSLGLAEDARSSLVLYRPLSADRLRHGVKSILNLRSGEDERKSHRVPLAIPATLHCVGIEQVLVFLANLSTGGAAFMVGQSVPPHSVQAIEFELPETKTVIKASLEVVWRDAKGRMGVHFAHLEPSQAESLEKWLAEHPSAQQANRANA